MAKKRPKRSSRGGKGGERAFKLAVLFVLGLIIVAVAFVVSGTFTGEAGSAPSGKVWNEAHGHYH